MKAELLSPNQFAKQLKLTDDLGLPNEQGIANLIRTLLTKQGLCTQRALLRYVRQNLIAAGVDASPLANSTLDRMLSIGECAEVVIAHERYVAPSERRWINVGNGVATFLSATALPEGISRIEPSSTREIAQRVALATDEDFTRMQLGGVREITFEEWLSPLGFQRHIARRNGAIVVDHRKTLSMFWDGILVETLNAIGQILSQDADVRYLTGSPGKFFGRHDALEPEGRWTSTAGDGIWCSYRRGYGESHWHPCIVAVDGSYRRALDLFDHDEWRWAVIARGKSCGDRELIIQTEVTASVTFPLPNQLRAAMDIIGSPLGAWSWATPLGAPKLMEYLP